jgi:hypothetical protein
MGLPSSRSSRRGTERLVVDLLGDANSGQLAASSFEPRPFLPGGEHNLYELAFAATALGWEVELRGWIDEPAYTKMADAVGVAPEVELPARHPVEDDLVVAPEGWQNPLEYARLLLSPARFVIFVLAAPGLFGWPFVRPGWTAPDPLTVPLHTLATPEYFQAVDSLGIDLVTHSPGIVDAAAAAGVDCAFVGIGRPDLPVQSARGSRTTDVAALVANRWRPFVDEVLPALDGLRVDLIEEAPNDEILRRLADARTLLWPSRIEGHATIPWEARLMGCVPVALSSNRFAIGLDEAGGAIVVDEVAQLAPAVRSVLGQPERLRELSARGPTQARREADWGAYLERVHAFLNRERPRRPEAGARETIGATLLAQEQERARRRQDRLEELSAELDRVRDDRDRLHATAGELAAERELIVADRDRIAAALSELRQQPVVRAALATRRATRHITRR